MQTYLDCYPCVLRQALEAARMAQAGPRETKSLVNRTLDLLKTLPEDLTPPEIGARVHRMVREMTGNPDPYRDVKDQATQKALDLLPRLRTLVAEAEDPLETAIRLSIAGNIIDFGPNPDYDLWDVVQRVLTQKPAIDHLAELRARLASADRALFLGDNAGETVFDHLLIETLDLPITYAVRGGPVLNDATLADARAVGIHEAAALIDNGARIPGTVLEACSPAFRRAFDAASLILAKGQGNYETLSEVQAPLFFLLQIKCPVIGRDIGAPAGSIVVKQGKGF
jgi:hypothetical protein